MALYPQFPTLQYVDWRPKRPAQNVLAGTVPPAQPGVSLGTMEQLGGPGIGGGGAQLGAGNRGDVPGPEQSTTETDDPADVAKGMTTALGLAMGSVPALATIGYSMVNNTPPAHQISLVNSLTDMLGLTDTVGDIARGLPSPNDLFGIDPFGMANADDVAAQLGIDPAMNSPAFGGGTVGDPGQQGGNPDTGDVAGDNSSNPGDVGDAGQYARGGLVTKRRLRGPNPPGPDDGSAALDAGEYVVRRSSTNKYGRNALAAINEGRVPANALRRLTRGGDRD